MSVEGMSFEQKPRVEKSQEEAAKYNEAVGDLMKSVDYFAESLRVGVQRANELVGGGEESARLAQGNEYYGNRAKEVKDLSDLLVKLAGKLRGALEAENPYGSVGFMDAKQLLEGSPNAG